MGCARAGLLFVGVAAFYLSPGQAAEWTVADEPQLLAPGVISTSKAEYNPSIDLERGELYFMRATPKRFDYTLFVSRLRDGRWTEPEVLEFSGMHRDDAPYISADGNTMYFDSNRPAGLERWSINMWSVSRRHDGWSEPELLPEPSTNPPPYENSSNDEFGPAVDAEGNLYFYGFRQPYRAGARYAVASGSVAKTRFDDSIPDPSPATFVSYLYVTPDGSMAVMDGNKEGRRDKDLFYSCRGADGWSEARSIDWLNTKRADYGPFMSADGSVLVFSSERHSGVSNAAGPNLYAVSGKRVRALCP